MIQPRADRVLIQRIEECKYGDSTCPCQDGDMCHYEGPNPWPAPKKNIILTDAPKGIKGVVLAVGPGKWHPGEWWYVTERPTKENGIHWEGWQWFDGYREPLTFKPGMKVLFNSKWNDFSHAENKGTGSDGSGPLERPLPVKADPMLHLVQEADIFAIVPDFNFKASTSPNSYEREHLRNIELNANVSD